jgi:hypothetical protein
MKKMRKRVIQRIMPQREHETLDDFIQENVQGR